MAVPGPAEAECAAAGVALVTAAELVAELTARGRSARLVVEAITGEADVRLVVGDGPVTGELLVPTGVADPGRWHAVRVKPAGRVVWRGPARGCPRAELLRFVEDLLDRAVDALAGRYWPLG